MEQYNWAARLPRLLHGRLEWTTQPTSLPVLYKPDDYRGLPQTGTGSRLQVCWNCERRIVLRSE